MSFNTGDNDHTDTHTDATDDQKEFSSEAVDDPHGIESEKNTKCSVQSVDEGNLAAASENLLVDLGRVRVERALASDLLTSVDNQSEEHTLAQRLVLPQSRVVSGDGLLLILNSFADL